MKNAELVNQIIILNKKIDSYEGIIEKYNQLKQDYTGAMEKIEIAKTKYDCMETKCSRVSAERDMLIGKLDESRIHNEDLEGRVNILIDTLYNVAEALHD